MIELIWESIINCYNITVNIQKNEKKKNYVCVNKDENNSKKKAKKSDRKNKNMKCTLLLQYEKRIFDWILTDMAEMEEKSVSKV